VVSRVAYNVPTASYAVGGFKGCIQRSVQLVASSVAYPRSVQLVASKGCIQRSVQLVASRVAYNVLCSWWLQGLHTTFCAVGGLRVAYNVLCSWWLPRVAYNVLCSWWLQGLHTTFCAVGGFERCIQRSVQLVASKGCIQRSVQLVVSRVAYPRSVQLVALRVAYPRSVQLVALRVAYNVPTAFCAVGSFHDQAECERHVLKRLCVALLKACS